MRRFWYPRPWERQRHENHAELISARIRSETPGMEETPEQIREFRLSVDRQQRKYRRARILDILGVWITGAIVMGALAFFAYMIEYSMEAQTACTNLSTTR